MTAENKLFSEEQHETLLASAVEKAVSEARKEADAEVLRLNEQLSDAEKAAAERDEKIKELESEIARRDEVARLEELADERVKLVKAVANFSDEQISQRKMYWAKMESEDFTSYLEDLKAVAKAAPKSDEPPASNFDGTRETAGDQGDEKEVLKGILSDPNVAAGKL